jgi:23S rRNA (guanosine2251-2'-O)-methyltransferase
MKGPIVILDNIRSVHNVGSIFRTADAAGVSMIYLVGVTPAPIDRFGRARKDFAKVSLGAEKNIDWKSVPEIFELILKLKEDGVSVVAVEQAKNSVSYKTLPKNKKIAFIFGEETKGLSKEVLASADFIAEIPMSGKKESLNVSVSAGIILFEMRD